MAGALDKRPVFELLNGKAPEEIFGELPRPVM